MCAGAHSQCTINAQLCPFPFSSPEQGHLRRDFQPRPKRREARSPFLYPQLETPKSSESQNTFPEFATTTFSNKT